MLKDDPVLGHAVDLSEIPRATVDRIEHYFATYKALPGSTHEVVIEERYSSDVACAVVEASIADYREAFTDEA